MNPILRFGVSRGADLLVHFATSKNQHIFLSFMREEQGNKTCTFLSFGPEHVVVQLNGGSFISVITSSLN